ncbi:MAG TPA: SBBP repeat-containing protein, partial [Flavipsychrobacter sp.]|nr:SBBP repeat-containing protein [Flavipsychrobacter sp.]
MFREKINNITFERVCFFFKVKDSSMEMPRFRQIIFVFCLSLSFLCSRQSQAQYFGWVQTFGASQIDYGSSITVDDAGNVYTTGHFWGTVDFDPGPGTFYLSSAGLMDIYICKLDGSGNLIWAKALQGSGGGGFVSNDDSHITLDKSGNIYIVGTFSDTTDFDPGNAVYSVVPLGMDLFILKLTNTGDFIWVKQIAAKNAPRHARIALGNKDDFYIIGTFRDSSDFDPGPGEYKLKTFVSGENSFVAKYNVNGDFLWAKLLGGNDMVRSHAICVDKFNNVAVAGDFVGTVDLDPGAGQFNKTAAITSGNGKMDIFFSKLDNDGNFLFGGSFGSVGFDNIGGIVTDKTGNLVITGYSVGTVDLDPGPGVNVVNPLGLSVPFLVKLDTAGSFVWGKSLQVATPLENHSRCLAVDSFSNIYGAGACVAKYDAAGNLIWSRNMNVEATAIKADNYGNVYITGGFRGSPDFNPAPGIFQKSSSGYDDAYVLKLTLINSITDLDQSLKVTVS